MRHALGLLGSLRGPESGVTLRDSWGLLRGPDMRSLALRCSKEFLELRGPGLINCSEPEFREFWNPARQPVGP